MSPDQGALPRETLPNRPLWLKTSADCTLDALVVAAAVIIGAQRPPRAASRLALLVAARRSGLLGLPPRRDLFAELDAHLVAFRRSAVERRRRLVGTMNMLVGSSAATLVWQAAEQIAATRGTVDPSERAVLLDLASALALRGPQLG